MEVGGGVMDEGWGLEGRGGGRGLEKTTTYIGIQRIL